MGRYEIGGAEVFICTSEEIHGETPAPPVPEPAPPPEPPVPPDDDEGETEYMVAPAVDPDDVYPPGHYQGD